MPARPEHQTLLHPEWERQPGESDLAYRYFAAYRDMEPRSLRAVAEMFERTVDTVEVQAAKWRWTDRLRARDGHLDAMRRVAMEQAELSEAQRWVERRAAKRERDWQLSDLLTRRAYQMIQWPLTEVTEEIEGEEETDLGTVIVRKKITVKPQKWNLGNVAGMLAAAESLAERALEMTDVSADREAVEQTVRDFALRQGLSPQLLLEMSADLTRQVQAAREEAARTARKSAADLSEPVEGEWGFDDNELIP